MFHAKCMARGLSLGLWVQPFGYYSFVIDQLWIQRIEFCSLYSYLVFYLKF